MSLLFETPGGRRFKISLDAVARRLATLLDNAAIDSDAAWAAHVNSRTSTQLDTYDRELFKALVEGITPPA